MSRVSRLIAVLLAVALPAVAAGCGSDAGVAGGSAEEVLATTFGPDRPVTSGRLDLAVSLDADGLAGIDGPVRMQLRGPFDAAPEGRGAPAFAFDLVVGTAGQTFTAGAISTGTAGFLTYGGRAYALDPDTWAALERSAPAGGADGAGPREGRTLAELGVEPLRWLRGPRRVGEEAVGGAQTVHVRAGVDVDALLDDVDRILARAAPGGSAAGREVPAGLTRAQRETIRAAVRSASVDVFTGADDGLLRRLNVQVAFAVPEGSRADAGGLRAGRLGLDLRLGELGEPQEIAAPKDPRPLAELTGGAAAAQGAGSSYEDCLDRAAGDLARAQECAGALGSP